VALRAPFSTAKQKRKNAGSNGDWLYRPRERVSSKCYPWKPFKSWDWVSGSPGRIRIDTWSLIRFGLLSRKVLRCNALGRDSSFWRRCYLSCEQKLKMNVCHTASSYTSSGNHFSVFLRGVCKFFFFSGGTTKIVTEVSRKRAYESSNKVWINVLSDKHDFILKYILMIIFALLLCWKFPI